MPYIIEDINDAKPKSKHRYFFDANIWLAILETVYWRRDYKPYIDFFNSIISNRIVKDATIAIPCLLLSEILNRILNDIYFNEYKANNAGFTGNFKAYRNQPQYQSDLKNVTGSIRQYHQKIEFISDNLDQYSCKDLIKNIPSHLDINDYLYSKIALEQGIIIVTNDGDFKVEDVHILTSRKTLLALMTPPNQNTV